MSVDIPRYSTFDRLQPRAPLSKSESEARFDSAENLALFLRENPRKPQSLQPQRRSLVTEPLQPKPSVGPLPASTEKPSIVPKRRLSPTPRSRKMGEFETKNPSLIPSEPEPEPKRPTSVTLGESGAEKTSLVPTGPKYPISLIKSEESTDGTEVSVIPSIRRPFPPGIPSKEFPLEITSKESPSSQTVNVPTPCGPIPINITIKHEMLCPPATATTVFTDIKTPTIITTTKPSVPLTEEMVSIYREREFRLQKEGRTYDPFVLQTSVKVWVDEVKNNPSFKTYAQLILGYLSGQFYIPEEKDLLDRLYKVDTLIQNKFQEIVKTGVLIPLNFSVLDTNYRGRAYFQGIANRAAASKLCAYLNNIDCYIAFNTSLFNSEPVLADLNIYETIELYLEPSTTQPKKLATIDGRVNRNGRPTSIGAINEFFAAYSKDYILFTAIDTDSKRRYGLYDEILSGISKK